MDKYGCHADLPVRLVKENHFGMAIQKEIYLFVNSFLDIKMSKFNWSRANINAQIYMKKNIILFNSDAHGQDSLFYDLGTACPAKRQVEG